MTRMEIDEAIGAALNVYVQHYRYRGDRRVMTSAMREKENTHVTITASVDIAADDPRAVDIARALAHTLSQFGL